MATLACRVQFLDDTDPFNSTNFPEPSRPPLFTFREDLALGTQLAGVHRLLRAPHKVQPGGVGWVLRTQPLSRGAPELGRRGQAGRGAVPGDQRPKADLPSPRGAEWPLGPGGGRGISRATEEDGPALPPGARGGRG